jgi:uncharacterized membrane protein
MDRISGLPTHPLLVHIPVGMLPLATLGVLVMLARVAWYERYRWAVLVVGAIGTLGAILAAASGESLESQIRNKEGAAAVRELHDHVEAGDMARNLAIVFFVVLALYVVLPWFLHRRADQAGADASTPAMPRWLRPTLMAAVALTAVVSTVTIIDAGHSGASRAWDEYNTNSSGG